MSKRHNRKRTRSRPRHRDAGKARSNNSQSFDLDAVSFIPGQSAHYPLAHMTSAGDPWQQVSQMQNQHRILRYQQEREKALEHQRLRFFGGYSDDEVSLFEPMLKVVTDLFDGNTDYEDP